MLEYRDAGYLPEAVFNFLGLLGWSLDDKTEIISRDEFVEHFDLDRLLKSPAVFNIEKLDWMNGDYMRQMPVEELAGAAHRAAGEAGGRGRPARPASQRPLDLEYTQRIVPLVRERVKLLPEARDMMAFFYLPDGVDPDADAAAGQGVRATTATAPRCCSRRRSSRPRASTTGRTKRSKQAYRELAARMEVKPGDLFMLMRVAVTGRSVAPPLFETMEILGRERCIPRLREAVAVLQ